MEPVAAAGVAWTHGFFLWYKFILGFGMVAVHTDMMAGRTIVGNIEWLKPSSRGQPKLTDATWRMRKTMCQLVQVLLVWGPMGAYFLVRHFETDGAKLSDLWDPSTDEYAAGRRPWILKFMDGLGILIVFVVNITRFLAYLGAKNTWFWMVRDLRHEERTRVSGEESGEEEAMWEFGFETWFKFGRRQRKEARTEGFIRMIATPTADTDRLGERLNRRPRERRWLGQLGRGQRQR